MILLVLNGYNICIAFPEIIGVFSYPNPCFKYLNFIVNWEDKHLDPSLKDNSIKLS